MSLTVYLHTGIEERPCTECGHQRQIKQCVYSANITHNLAAMASAAGLYAALWRPDEIGITKAGQLIEPLWEGLVRLRTNPENFKKLNPANGWGSYDDFVPWVRSYLAACELHPEAEVSASS